MIGAGGMGGGCGLRFSDWVLSLDDSEEDDSELLEPMSAPAGTGWWGSSGFSGTTRRSTSVNPLVKSSAGRLVMALTGSTDAAAFAAADVVVKVGWANPATVVVAVE